MFSRHVCWLAAVVTAILQASAWGSTWYVDQLNPGSSDTNLGTQTSPWRTIQRGASAALAGDTVIVLPGDYPENVHIRKRLNLVGQGGPRLLGSGTSQGFSIEADDVSIEGFRIENYGTGIAPLYYQGVYARARIRNNYLHLVGHGIWIAGDAWLVEGNEVDRILLGGEDYGNIFGTNHVVRRNFFHGTIIPDDLGIGPDYAHNDCMQFWNNNGEVLHDILIEENIFTDFVQGIFIANETGVLSSMSNVTVRNNVFWGTRFISDGNLLGWPSHGTFFGKADIPGVVIENNLYRTMGNCITLYDMLNVWVERNVIVDAGTVYALGDGTTSSALHRGVFGNIVWHNSWNGNASKGPDVYIDPQLRDVTSLLGPDGIPFTDDDGWRPTNPLVAGYGPQIFTAQSTPNIACVNLRNGMRWLDTNQDGYIDLAESRLDAATFGNLDLSSDGYLSMTELLASSAGTPGVRNPVYVDFHHAGWEDGTAAHPFNSLIEAVNFVAPGGLIVIAPQSASEPIRITGAMTLVHNATAP